MVSQQVGIGVICVDVDLDGDENVDLNDDENVEWRKTQKANLSPAVITGEATCVSCSSLLLTYALLLVP